MFETIFQDALYKKAQQDPINTLRAMETNSRVRRDNPTMIQYNPNLVDFSNPESVARAQTPVVNPFGYATPNLNPNIRPPNPYQQALPRYASPIYYQNNGYGFRYGVYNMDNLTPADTAKFMIPLPGDKRIPKGGICKPGEQPKKQSSPDKGFRSLSYKEAKAMIPKAVFVRPGKDFIREKKPHRQRQIKTEFIHKEWKPWDIVTREDLNMDNRIIKMIVETPLDWSREDAKELVDLLDQLYVYNKALAFFIGEDLVMNRETSGFNNWSRERYERMMEYLQNRLEEYRKNEKQFPNLVDYRAKYQYIPLPAYQMDEDNDPIFPIQLDPVAEIERDHLTKEKIYKYDRGRDWLTPEEWEVFKAFEHFRLEQGIDRILAKEMVELNSHINPDPEQPKSEPQLPPWNPNDPVTVKLYRMREQEKAYQNHKDFFRYLTRHSLTDEQFDNWWWGTNTTVRQPQKQLTKEEQHRLWAQDMSRRHLQFLNSLQRVDYAQQGELWRAEAIKRLREYDRGLEPADLSLTEFFNRLGYLAIVRPHELELKKQIQENARKVQRESSQNTFMHNMYLASNNYYQQQQAKNPNKQYIPKYGTIDPRYNMPTTFVDLTNNPQSQINRETVNYTMQHMGRIPELHTLYK